MRVMRVCEHSAELSHRARAQRVVLHDCGAWM